MTSLDDEDTIEAVAAAAVVTAFSVVSILAVVLSSANNVTLRYIRILFPA